MISYSGWQWLLIDAANQFGCDKLLFEQRIKWATDNITILEHLTKTADKKPLYIKAVMAIRKAQQGVSTGHIVAVDSVCSGIQIMSVLTGCLSGARATGLIDPNVRADAYTEVTKTMEAILGGYVKVSRDDAKSAVMTSYYGSTAVPKELFGEDTPELNAFYEAANKVAPGAWELLQDLLASWQPYALSHEWKLPDGYDAKVKVMVKKETRIEVDELNHATFSYEFFDNEGAKKGKSNVANLVHSMDAYILRCMHRRCNYNQEVVEKAAKLIEIELLLNNLGMKRRAPHPVGKVQYYIQQYIDSTLADVVILPYLTEDTIKDLSIKHLKELATITYGMLQYKPFELVTIHDAFGSLPNNVNWVRWQYKEILAEIADSDVLSGLLSQINKKHGVFVKQSQLPIGSQIRNSNYALT